MTVQFRLLGDIEVWAGERVVDIGHARRRHVLGVLLASVNQVVPAGQLVERVWGEKLPANPAGALQSYISLLRRMAGIAGNVTIARQAPGYKAVAEADTIDLHRFQNLIGAARAARSDDDMAAALAQALGLWRGECLAGLDTPWASAIRATLAVQRRAALADLTDIQLRRGEHAALLSELTVQASDHPLDERVAAQLMLALYRSGRQADALGHYERTRRRLARELGTDPGPPLRELHQLILAADPALAIPAKATAVAPATAPLPASASSPAAIPRQLPAPPGFFTGRTAELGRLTTLLDRPAEPAGTVVIAAIAGTGGIGKTWLALAWAHQHLGRFPDGQLWVDLRGFDPAQAPMPAATALRGFLDALGVDPAAIPGDLEAQIGLHRSLLAGKRMLLVLDNAQDSSQVMPLLPGRSECTVLVTSRRQLTGLVTGHGARPLDLDVFPGEQARELLARCLGRERLAAEPDAVTELLAGCAGLPLAVSVVAARATVHPGFPLTALAAELREATTRLDALETGDLTASVRAVLACSYRALAPRPAAVFGQLGLAPGPDISLDAAAALTMLPAAQARAVLRDLESASLVQEHAPGRYKMHDLVRLYAAEQARRDQAADTQTAALRRVTDFYLHAARALGRPPAGGAGAEAMTWFAAEHACLLASQRLALARGWHEPAWQLARALNTFHRRGGHFGDWIESWQAGLTAAEQLGRPAAQGVARGWLGFACAHAGRHAEALDHLGRGLAWAERAGNLARQAHLHTFLCFAWSRREDHRLALSHATSARSLFRALGDRVWEADALGSAGSCQAHLGHLGEAQASCEAALALHRQHGFREGEARMLDSLGYIAHHTGDHARALDYYARALALHRELGHTYRLPGIQAGLAAAHAARGEHDAARRAWQQALDLCQAQHRIPEAAAIAQQLAALP